MRLMRPHALVAVGILLVTSIVWVVGGAASDVQARNASPEATVRAYFAALEQGDVDGALSTLPQSIRGTWTPFVENGLHNEYRIVGVAVRSTSLMDQFRGMPAGPQDVTIFLDITQNVDGVRWQAGPRVPLMLTEGRWLLAHPPLAEPA